MFRDLKEKAENVAHIQGKWHIINLKQKKGLFVNFPVYILHNGTMGLDRPFLQDDWVFRG